MVSTVGASEDRWPPVLGRLLRAVNAHNVEEIVSCFADDYVNETPAHPRRSFRGSHQVRQNWRRIIAGVPDVQAQVPRTSVEGDALWTEWEMSGTRTDGGTFLMRGVVIFGVAEDTIAWARFYLEPVENTSGDVNAHTWRVAGRADELGPPAAQAAPRMETT